MLGMKKRAAERENLNAAIATSRSLAASVEKLSGDVKPLFTELLELRQQNQRLTRINAAALDHLRQVVTLKDRDELEAARAVNAAAAYLKLNGAL